AEDAMKAIARTSLSVLPPGIRGEQRVILSRVMASIGGLDAYEVTRLEALDNVSDPTQGRYRFLLRRDPNIERTGFAKQETIGQFQERVQRDFGRLKDWKIVEVTEAKPMGNDVEITTGPTPSTRQFWPHRTSIF